MPYTTFPRIKEKLFCSRRCAILYRTGEGKTPEMDNLDRKSDCLHYNKCLSELCRSGGSIMPCDGCEKYEPDPDFAREEYHGTNFEFSPETDSMTLSRWERD
jgi:hypothetical protein